MTPKRWRIRLAVWAGLALTGVLVSGALAQSLAEQEARRQLGQALTATQGGRVYTGADIGFRTKGVDRGTPVVVPVVKVNGEWVEVQLGMPGLQRLTQ